MCTTGGSESLPSDRRDDLLGNDLVAEAAPDAALPVIPAGEHDHEVELRDHHQELAAVAGRLVLAIRPLPGAQPVQVPGVRVLPLAVELGEAVLVEAGRLRRDLHGRRGRPGNPGRVDDPAAAPDAAVELRLADLEEIPRPQER